MEHVRSDARKAAWPARCRKPRVGGLLFRVFRGLTTAILVTGVGTDGTEAHAQSRSRAEVQLGGTVLHTMPGFVLGGTGWIGERGGVAARVFFLPGRGLDIGSPRAFDAGLRYRGFYRGFTQDVEVDFGMSLAAMKAEGSITPVSTPSGRREPRPWHQYLTVDVLLGRRLAERLHLKVGAGVVLSPDGVGFVATALVVAPIGRR